MATSKKDWEVATYMNLSKTGILGADGDLINENLVQGTSSQYQSASIGQYYTSLHTDTGFWGLVANDKVVYSVYFKAPPGKKIRARIQFYNSNEDRPNLYGNFINAGEEGVSIISFTLTSAQRAYSRMELLADCNDGTTNTDTFYWKKLKLEKGSTPTIWTPYESNGIPQGFIEGSDIFRVFDGHYEANEFIEF